MIIADLRYEGGWDTWPVGALGNIREWPCAKTVEEAAAIPTCAAHAHQDPEAGCERVVLSRRPVAGERGPFGYDRTTGTPIPHAENTALAHTAALDAAALDKFRLLQRRDALVQAKKDTIATDAELAIVEARIAAAIGGSP